MHKLLKIASLNEVVTTLFFIFNPHICTHLSLYKVYNLVQHEESEKWLQECA